tara:strand:- start:492 stop:1703 length:1212 start_codon:yes stop_codon:yes gene_type:complete
VKKIKILRIINRLNIGGPTYNVTYLSKYLDSKYETLLIAGNKLKSEAKSDFIPKKYGLNPRYLKYMFREINLFNDIKAYREIRKIIREYKPDIVHTHAAKPGAIGRMAAINENVPFIFHTFHGHVFHSYFNSFKTYIFKVIERYLATRSTKVIAISDLQKKDLVSNYKIAKRDKIEVIRLGFDFSNLQNNINSKRKFFRKEFQLNSSDILIGIIGRLTHIKNHKLFIDTAKYILNKTNQSIKFFIIGDGEDKQSLFEYCNKKKISYYDSNSSSINKNDFSIYFTSWRRDIDYVISGLDIISLTSFNEGTPVSLIESQAAGKPVISTNVGGVSDIIKDKKTGIIVNSFDYRDYANKLYDLINDKELRKYMSKEGPKFIENKYSYKTLVNNIDNLYKRHLKKHKK